MRAAAAVIAFALAAIQPASAQTSGPARPTADAPARRARPVKPAALVLGANEVAGSVIQAGWPMVVSALLVAGRDSTGALVMPRRPAIEIRLLDARGTVVPLVLEAVGAPRETDGTVQWFWLAGETATRSLAPGSYRIAAAADAAGSTSVRVLRGSLEVEVAGPTPDRRLSLLRLQRALLLGSPGDALAEADRMIAADSTDAVAWEARGDLLMERDLPDDALQAYTRAAGHDLNPRAVGPDIARKRKQAFLKGLEKRGVRP